MAAEQNALHKVGVQLLDRNKKIDGALDLSFETGSSQTFSMDHWLAACLACSSS